MKNYLIIAAVFVSALSFTSCAPGAYVEARPSNVVYARPVAPGPGYVWIGGDWMWVGGRYQWHEGRWDRPRAGRVWHDGGWT